MLLGLERFVDQFVGNVRPAELGGIDVVSDPPPPHGGGRPMLVDDLGWPEDSRTRQLHSAETDALNSVAGKLVAVVAHLGSTESRPPWLLAVVSSIESPHPGQAGSRI